MEGILIEAMRLVGSKSAFVLIDKPTRWSASIKAFSAASGIMTGQLRISWQCWTLS
jgi:hypothetical protein